MNKFYGFAQNRKWILGNSNTWLKKASNTSDLALEIKLPAKEEFMNLGIFLCVKILRKVGLFYYENVTHIQMFGNMQRGWFKALEACKIKL